MIHNSNNTQNDFVICNCNSTEYMIPAGNGNKYKLIQSANGLTGDLIKVGQKLKIPKG